MSGSAQTVSWADPAAKATPAYLPALRRRAHARFPAERGREWNVLFPLIHMSVDSSLPDDDVMKYTDKIMGNGGPAR
jgi:hypothetical protein